MGGVASLTTWNSRLAVCAVERSSVVMYDLPYALGARCASLLLLDTFPTNAFCPSHTVDDGRMHAGRQAKTRCALDSALLVTVYSDVRRTPLPGWSCKTILSFVFPMYVAGGEESNILSRGTGVEIIFGPQRVHLVSARQVSPLTTARGGALRSG